MHTMKEAGQTACHLVLLTVLELPIDQKQGREKKARVSLQSICLTSQKYKTVLDMKSSVEELATHCTNFFKTKKTSSLNYFAFLLSDSTILIGAANIKESWWTEFEDSYYKLDILGGEADKKLRDFSLNTFNSFNSRMALLFKSEEISAYGINIVRFKPYNETHLESKTKVSKEETVVVDHALDLSKLKTLNTSNDYSHIFIDDSTHTLVILGLMLENAPDDPKSKRQTVLDDDDDDMPKYNEFIRFQVCNLRECDNKFELNANKRDIAANLKEWLSSTESFDSSRFKTPELDGSLGSDRRFISLLHPKINCCEFSFDTELHYFYGLLVLRTFTNSIWLLLTFRSKNKKNNEFMKVKLVEYKINPTVPQAPTATNTGEPITVQAMDNECLVNQKVYSEATDYYVQVGLSLSNNTIMCFEVQDILHSIKYNQNAKPDSSTNDNRTNQAAAPKRKP